MESLKKLQAINPISVIYPGHGPTVKNPSQRIQAYIEHRMKRNEQILSALKNTERPLSVLDLVNIIYTVSVCGVCEYFSIKT
jgi:ribonuclease/clavin/mitogillin